MQICPTEIIQPPPLHIQHADIIAGTCIGFSVHFTKLKSHIYVSAVLEQSQVDIWGLSPVRTKSPCQNQNISQVFPQIFITSKIHNSVTGMAVDLSLKTAALVIEPLFFFFLFLVTSLPHNNPPSTFIHRASRHQ